MIRRMHDGPRNLSQTWLVFGESITFGGRQWDRVGLSFGIFITDEFFSTVDD